MLRPNRMLAVLPAIILICTTTMLNAQSGISNSPKATTTVLDCGAAGQVTTVTPSNPTPISLNLGSNAVFVSTSAMYTVRDAITNEVILTTQTIAYGAGHGRATGIQGNLITCTSQPIFVTDPELGPISFTILLTGVMVPK
jgi:hypothetical protein